MNTVKITTNVCNFTLKMAPKNRQKVDTLMSVCFGTRKIFLVFKKRDLI